MERILSDNEKIRKAEEIYYRRNHKNIDFVKPQIRQKTYIGSKIILEFLILVLLAITVFAIKNKNYIFTQDFLQSFAKYNVNISSKIDFVKRFFVDENNGDEIFIKETEQIQENAQIENVQNSEENVPPESTQIQEQQLQQEEPQGLVNFIKPIQGIVTSRFGSRNSEYKNVSKNHTGIDIASELGTPITASMSGIVTQVSNEGDYGNHLKISQNNIDTLYAHCQEIFVSEGQAVAQGQVIATVGSTGNSTGPHLHFEIRVDGEPMNPDEILQF